MNFTPPTDVALGSIAINEENKIIVLNANHRLCDGGFFKFLMNNYISGNWPKDSPKFPRFTSDLFNDRISKSPKVLSLLNDPTVTRIHNIEPMHDIKLLPNNISTRVFKDVYHPDSKDYNFAGNIIDSSTNQKRYMNNVEIVIPAKNYKTYNPKTNAPSHLTEYLWLSQFLVGSALNGKPFTSFKIKTVNDLRRYLPNPGFVDCYHCSVTAPSVPSISLDDKLSTIGRKLRKDLFNMMDAGINFSVLKSPVDQEKIITGIDFGITGVGAIRIKKPIVDAHLSFLANATQIGNVSNYIGSIFLSTVSAFNLSTHENNIVSKVSYNPNLFSEKDIKTYMERIRYILTNVSLDETVGNVFDKVIKIK